MNKKQFAFFFLSTFYASLLFLSCAVNEKVAFAATDKPPLAIIVNGDKDYPPYEYLDGNKPTGFNIDMINAVSEVMGIQANIRLGPWNEVRTNLEQGKTDVLAGMYYSLEREKIFDFSIPHILVSSALFVRSPSTFHSFQDIRNKEIIVQKADIMHDFLISEKITPHIITVTNPLQALQMLASGKHDAALLSSKIQGLYFVNKHKLSNIRVVETNYPVRKYCFAVNKGNEELLNKLNEGLNILKNTGRYKIIHEKWFGVYERKESGNVFKYLVIAIITIFVLLTALLILSWFLRAQVQIKIKELHLSEEKYRSIFENAVEGIFQSTPAGLFINVNPAMAKMCQYESPDIMTKAITDIDTQHYVNPEDRKRFISILKENGRVDNLEYQIYRQDGSRIWVTVNARVVSNDQGHILYYEGSCQDITARKIAEEALKASEQQMKAFVNASPIPQFVIDQEHRVIHWNQALEEYSGIQAVDISGTNQHWRAFYNYERPCMADLLVDGTIEAIPEWYRDKYSRSKLIDGAFEAIDFFPTMHDGTWLYFTAAPIRDTKGAIVGAVETLIDITERKQAEDELTESQRRLQDIIDFLPDATVVIDKDGKVIAWNRAIEIMTGVKAGDMLGKGDYEYAIPFYGDKRPILIDLALQADPEMEKEYTTIQRIGEILFGESYTPKLAPGNVHLSATASVLRNSKEEIVGAIECIRNNTERKQVADALREGERRLADIINFLPDAVLVIDNNGHVLAWNRAMENMTGVNSEDVLGKGNYEYALPFYGERRPILIDLVLQPAQEVEKKYRNVKWQGDVLIGDTYLPNLRGESVYLLGTASPLYNTKGTIVGAIETIRDITDRYQMEAAILEERERLASILDGTPVPAFVIDRDRNVILWNRSNEMYLGKAKDEMLGRKLDLRFLYKGEEVPSLAELMLAMTNDEIITKYMEKGVRRSEVPADSLEVIRNIWLHNEQRIISIQAKRIYGTKDEIIGVIQTAQDITERIHLETQFRQAQKMEAIGTLAGGIAHDFNNILGAIMGYTELYMEQARALPKVYHGMEEVLKAAMRAKDLVQQILAFSRKSAQEKTPTMLVPIIKEVTKFIRASLPTTIEIKQSLNVTSDVIMADPTQMHQVLMNLCTNAGQAMKGTGGRLEIYLAEVFIGKEEQGLFPSLAIGHYLKLTVMDTGHGIKSENLDKIFEPYFTTKGKGEGTGLGLAVVHGIVKDHSGEIKVYSEIGKGSVFNVYLPLIESRTAVISPAAESILPGGSEKILFIDDETMLVDVCKLFLEELGYEVFAQTDPVEAIEVFRKDKGSFDLVITDKTMPHMTGFDVAREIKSIRADIPLILCSGFQEKQDFENISALGISRFITKPIVMRTLAETVRNVLDKKTP